MELSTVSGKLSPLHRVHPNPASHLLFANDILIVCKQTKPLFMNFTGRGQVDKSKLFFSKECKAKEELSSIIGIPIGKLPIKNPGLPLSHNYLKAKDFRCFG